MQHCLVLLNLAKIILNYITAFTHSSSGNKFFCLKNCRLLTMTLEPFLLKVCVTMETARDCTFHMILILKDYNRCTSDSQSCLTLPVLHNYILTNISLKGPFQSQVETFWCTLDHFIQYANRVVLNTPAINIRKCCVWKFFQLYITEHREMEKCIHIRQ